MDKRPLVLPASWYRTVIRIAQRIALEKAQAEAAEQAALLPKEVSA